MSVIASRWRRAWPWPAAAGVCGAGAVLRGRVAQVTCTQPDGAPADLGWSGWPTTTAPLTTCHRSVRAAWWCADGVATARQRKRGVYGRDRDVHELRRAATSRGPAMALAYDCFVEARRRATTMEPRRRRLPGVATRSTARKRALWRGGIGETRDGTVPIASTFAGGTLSAHVRLGDRLRLRRRLTTGGHAPDGPSGPDTSRDNLRCGRLSGRDTHPTLSLANTGLLDGAVRAAPCRLTINASAIAGIEKLEVTPVTA